MGRWGKEAHLEADIYMEAGAISDAAWDFLQPMNEANVSVSQSHFSLTPKCHTGCIYGPHIPF